MNSAEETVVTLDAWRDNRPSFVQRFSFGIVEDDDMQYERISYNKRLDEEFEVWQPSAHYIFIDIRFKDADPT